MGGGGVTTVLAGMGRGVGVGVEVFGPFPSLTYLLYQRDDPGGRFSKNCLYFLPKHGSSVSFSDREGLPERVHIYWQWLYSCQTLVHVPALQDPL